MQPLHTVSTEARCVEHFTARASEPRAPAKAHNRVEAGSRHPLRTAHDAGQPAEVKLLPAHSKHDDNPNADPKRPEQVIPSSNWTCWPNSRINIHFHPKRSLPRACRSKQGSTGHTGNQTSCEHTPLPEAPPRRDVLKQQGPPFNAKNKQGKTQLQEVEDHGMGSQRIRHENHERKRIAATRVTPPATNYVTM